MNKLFNKIGVIGKYGDHNINPTLERLIQYLQDQGKEVLLESGTASTMNCASCSHQDYAQLSNNCDLVIVVGGDGSLLSAARNLSNPDTAILGINLGRLGFLVDISPDEIEERLDEILAGNYAEEQRSLLQTQVLRGGTIVHHSTALNDIVTHKLNIARMVELEVSIDGHYLYNQRSDGLVVSTPTGSTAYALSGGGPILHPTLAAMVLVPICPHTLSNRPIVIGNDSTIEIIIRADNKAQLTCDGQINYELEANDHILIKKKEHALRLIHPPGHDCFETLRAKLHWGTHP
ncbi:MAG: NAD(+) kinase [Gammaproteobacteria bacterium]|nr:NAD(+) kinase [Gammaproteobacteria bacterium]